MLIQLHDTHTQPWKWPSSTEFILKHCGGHFQSIKIAALLCETSVAGRNRWKQRGMKKYCRNNSIHIHNSASYHQVGSQPCSTVLITSLCFLFCKDINLSPICVSATSHLIQPILYESLFKVNNSVEPHFFLVRHTRHCFLCSSPFPWKIYERCPGGREFPATPGSLWQNNNRVSAATGTRAGQDALIIQSGKGGEAEKNGVAGRDCDEAGGGEDFFAFRSTCGSSQSHHVNGND